MGKGSNFFGQPIYGQLKKSLNREKFSKSVENMAERGTSRASMAILICLQCCML